MKVLMEHEQDFRDEEAHNWDFQLSFSCSEKYDQFVNWLSYEFYFFQQDQDRLFTIYFPNGKVQVEKEEHHDRTLLSKVTIESKCQKIGLKMKKKVSEFLHHIEKYHKLSQ
ncbi:hypothetical protein [uncultured Gelidibacter sp.]|uniref:hypothetical protein n=1 Tax=uncultured Gelidibacter sp. TaxID=259318 RepID=UPI002609DED3|nr:hypothetical protein [uncultured Gelidibacter sp.]